jgi:hypothetical protein
MVTGLERRQDLAGGPIEVIRVAFVERGDHARGQLGAHLSPSLTRSHQ